MQSLQREMYNHCEMGRAFNAKGSVHSLRKWGCIHYERGGKHSRNQCERGCAILENGDVLSLQMGMCYRCKKCGEVDGDLTVGLSFCDISLRVVL